jgi:hypothetical protein
MRRSSIAGAWGYAIMSGACAWVGCVDSPSPSPALPDASGPSFDAGHPTIFDAAPNDATILDAAPNDATVDSAPPIDAGADVALDAQTPDASDAAPDAHDSGADAGAGTVTSASGLALKAVRQGHSATLLTNGHVLFCGGYYGANGSLASCDDFDPIANATTAGPPLNVGRQGHLAVVLANGQVLFAGGAGTTDAGAFDALRSAEIYDPGTHQFTMVKNPMAQARSGGGGVLITSGPNAGKVVLVGGYGDQTFDSGVANDTALDTAEVFDPGTDATNGTFTPLAAHLSARRGGSMTAAALPDGGLLAAGGSYGPGGGPYTYLSSAETLDPALSAFTATANTMSYGRQGATSVVMTSGNVFVASGYGSSGYAPTADIFDPAARSFTTATLPSARSYVAVAPLKSGRVLVAGGVSSAGTLGEVLVYDPLTKAFLPTSGALSPARALATATTLSDGRVIIAGGQMQTGFITNAVDIFTE